MKWIKLTHSLSINCHFHLENEVCKTNNVKKRRNKEIYIAKKKIVW